MDTIQGLEIEHMFSYHAPKGSQLKRYEDLRQKAKEMAILISDLCPESKEKDLSIQYLGVSNMLANASIARHE